jgi:DNA-binding transcriptional MerR regulator
MLRPAHLAVHDRGPRVKRPARPAPERLRMKDLCTRTGLPRQAIHFYIQQGLLPPGHKTGRNSAFYGPEHVERVNIIRRLQHERFLPLKAIRALLDERADAYSPEQQRLLAEVREHLPAALGSAAPEAAVDALPLAERFGLDAQDLRELEQAGLLHTHEDAAGRPLVAAGDIGLLELFGQLRAAGFARELGFSALDLGIYQDAIAQLFAAEKRLLADRVAGRVGAAAVAPMVERALPVIHALLARIHVSFVKNMFASLPSSATTRTKEP